MIDDRERATLEELERHLRRYDPRYMQAFEAEADGMPAPRGGHAAQVHSILLMLSGALALLLVTMGWFAEAAVLVAVAALAWQARRRSRRSPRPAEARE